MGGMEKISNSRKVKSLKHIPPQSAGLSMLHYSPLYSILDSIVPGKTFSSEKIIHSLKVTRAPSKHLEGRM
jgi:hypothetical protein